MAFDHIRLEKGMYRESGKTFTQVLERLDPSENYKGTAFEGTDAFQRQLKRFDIRVKGAGLPPTNLPCFSRSLSPASSSRAWRRPTSCR